MVCNREEHETETPHIAISTASSLPTMEGSASALSFIGEEWQECEDEE